MNDTVNKVLANALPLLDFVRAVMPTLIDLAGKLFVKHGGNPESAKEEIERIPDLWKDYPQEKAAQHKELEELKAQGK